jgi:hypothetical protein
MYDRFASNLGIEQNWNRLDSPSIFIVPLPFFLYVESLHWKPKYSLFWYTDCIHSVNSVDSYRWKQSSAHDIA